jgi:diacylglycerol kinase (ATP)
MKVLLVFNPIAAHKRAGKLLPEIEAGFTELNISFDLRLTDYPEHAVEIVREADFDLYDGIAVAGGDGTLFESINGYYQNQSQRKIPIGVLPIGTGNAFARDLELQTFQWREALEIIHKNKPRKVDAGSFTTHGQKYYFLNIMGLGFVADVTKTAHKLKLIGNVSYTIGVLYQTIFLKTFKLKMEADGKVVERESVFVEISNTRYTSNFLMAPNAGIDDGLLDVTIFSRLNRRRLLQCFPKIFTGEHLEMDEIEQFKAKNIMIETEKPKVITPDGELVGISPVTVECLHQDVPVFWK